MKLKWLIGAIVGIGVLVAGLAVAGKLPLGRSIEKVRAAKPTPPEAPALAVTVARAEPTLFVETVLVTGSIVPREEILVGPEVEGLRIVDVMAEEGDKVKKGQPMARLVSDTLEAQLAQNDAALRRAEAAIAQSESNIVSMEARLVEARNAYNRGMPLSKSGYLSESGMDQRDTAVKTATAAVAVARDGLRLATAEKAQIEAQRREIAWRRGRTEIAAPADGIVSRRMARVGGMAAGAAEPLFRIVAKGEVELDAEVSETKLWGIREGQRAQIQSAGGVQIEGVVRLVSPEIDKATRLGRVRIMIGEMGPLKVGAFARGTIEIGRRRSLAVPASAVLYGADGPSVQIVDNGKVVTRKVRVGLVQATVVEIVDGIAEGVPVVAKSGTFLREGDAVRPVVGDDRRVSEAG